MFDLLLLIYIFKLATFNMLWDSNTAGSCGVILGTWNNLYKPQCLMEVVVLPFNKLFVSNIIEVEVYEEVEVYIDE